MLATWQPPLAFIDGFLHPGLAVGAALALVPLAIHLLNRQRHKPMSWAAMRFVEAAWKKTRRRARLEEWLLLCLRMAAIALLAFALARPFLGARSPLSMLTERRRDVIAILDVSASTGYRVQTRSVFEAITERTRELLAGLDASRGDRARVLTAGAVPQLIAWRSPAEALAAVAALESPTDERGDLVAALGEAARLIEADGDQANIGEQELWLLCDLQRNAFLDDFGREDAPAGTDLAAQVARLIALGTKIQVLDMGRKEDGRTNLGVTAIRVQGTNLAAGASQPIEVEVRNGATSGRALARVALDVNGERRPAQTLEVPAGSSARAQFEVVFPASGEHLVEARLEPDPLAFDDMRAAVVSVPAPVRVLIVNGEASADVERDEVAFLVAALTPPRGDEIGGQGAPFDVRTVEPFQLWDGSLDLANFDVLFLANVGALSAEVTSQIETQVAHGAALVLSMGKVTEAARQVLNARLVQGDGSGLLPAALGARVSVADRRANWWRARSFDHAHPVLEFFADERWKALLTEVPVYDFLSMRVDDQPAPGQGSGARALIRLDDEAHSPLLVERTFDRGKVLVWLTSIDAEWARVVESPSTFVPLVHELVRYAGTPSPPQRNVAVGSRPMLRLPPGAFPGAASAVLPDGTKRPLAGEATGDGAQDGSRGWILPPLEWTDRAGVVRVETAGAGTWTVAVQAEAGEGDLERISAAELRQIHPALAPAGEVTSQAGVQDPAGGRGELWRILAGLCLAVLAAETLWAAWIGARRGRSV